MATTTPGPDGATRSSRRFVRAAFVFVALGALTATGFAVAQARRLEAQARVAVSNTMTSIRLAGQLENQVEKRRILVDDHIFAKDVGEMAALDRQLETLDADLAARLKAYEAWLYVPGERAVWDRTLADLAQLDAPIGRALALSRVNRDVEAKRVMDGVAQQFSAVEKDFDDLIAINDRGALESFADLSRIRHRLVVTLFGIGVASLVGIAATGRWSLRQIARHEEEMRLYAQQLEQRNSELDAFAGRVAHDIRGGLTTISLAMTPLSKKIAPDDAALQILRRGTQRMEALVEDLLTLARVEGQVRGQCDPALVVSQLVQELAPRIEAAHGALRVSVAPASVACSEGLLRQALMNLIDNAVKYRRADVRAEVEVAGGPAEGAYDLRVSDNGVGMSKEDTRHLGEPFYRSSRTRTVPGTGLGLSIVNRLVEASGGSLSLRTRVGEGSTFVIHLPLAGGEDSQGQGQGDAGARPA